MESSTIAIIITVVSMILFFSNKLPMSVVGSITALACGLLIPEMSKSSVYSSFGDVRFPEQLRLYCHVDAHYRRCCRRLQRTDPL